MKLKSTALMFCLFYLTCSACTNQLDDAQAVNAKQIVQSLIPVAAGIDRNDFEAFSSGSASSLSDAIQDGSTPLTLCLINMQFLTTDSESMEAEFESLTGTPDPSMLVAEIQRPIDGHPDVVTLIHSDRITSFEVALNGDSATGWFGFGILDDMRGNVHFTAERKLKWEIKEFSMPARNLKIQLDETGKWRKAKEPSADAG